jgi:hypothetical protein
VVTPAERVGLSDDFCAAAICQPTYSRHGPNSPELADDHALELAMAGGVQHWVTRNMQDLERAELAFTSPRVPTPPQHRRAIP